MLLANYFNKIRVIPAARGPSALYADSPPEVRPSLYVIKAARADARLVEVRSTPGTKAAYRAPARKVRPEAHCRPSALSKPEFRDLAAYETRGAPLARACLRPEAAVWGARAIGCNESEAEICGANESGPLAPVLTSIFPLIIRSIPAPSQRQ